MRIPVHAARLPIALLLAVLASCFPPKRARPPLDPSQVSPGAGFSCTQQVGGTESFCHRSEAECVAFRHDLTRTQGAATTECLHHDEAYCFVLEAVQSAAGTPIPAESQCYLTEPECGYGSDNYYRSSVGDRVTGCGLVR